MKEEYEEFYALYLDEFVKVRADFRCERCGRRPEYAFWFAQQQHFAGLLRGTFPSSKVKLAVHHRDGNPKNNRLSNLICLCQRCHLFAERQNRKFPQVSLLKWLCV